MQAGLNRGVPAPAGGVLPAVATLAACEPNNRGHGRHGHGDDDND
jgi:hypothetical protein